MGYTTPHRQYPLPLGTEYAGLEVTVSDVSIGDYLKIAGFTEGADRSVSYAFEQFCANLIAWNLEEDDAAHTPIPVSAAADQDKELMLALTTAWVESLHGVSGPLEPTSPAGPQSPEVPIPMDVL